MNWACEDGEGNVLTELRFAPLLDWLKRFVWSLYSDPARGKSPFAASTLGVLNGGIGHFARWMMQGGRLTPDQLDETALNEYRESIIEAAGAAVDDEDAGEDWDISVSFAFNRVRVPILLWQQRHVLQQAGIPLMPQAPWDGKSINDVTLEISTKAVGWIKPVPAEVAIPILNSAARFIGERGQDVVRLQKAVLDARDRGDAGHYNGTGASKTARDVRSRRAAEAFQFSVLPGEHAPWHAQLKRVRYSRHERTGVLPQVRQLVMKVRDAASIVIQASTGMRVSELCGLVAGVGRDGLPSAVRIEKSASGLNEVFVLRSVLSKNEDSPIEVDWVVGMRPAGSTNLPLPVQAILLLDQLFNPHRVLLGTDALLVSLDAGLGLPEAAGSVRRITGGQILSGQKRFVSENVDLSGLPDESAMKVEDNDLVKWRESCGTIIRTHQFRKFFAAFVLGVDERLLPALRMHFHHVSEATTDYAYWGSNRAQVEPLSTVRAQQTNMLLFQLATGKTLLAGGMGEQLESHVEEIRSRVAGKSTSEAWKQVISYSAETDIRLWFSPHGLCLPLDRSEMLCHRDSDLSPWLRRQPNYAARDSATCLGCKCFVVDRRHAHFWEQKFIDNWISFRKAQQQAREEGTFRVVKLRAMQARSLLSKLGVDVVGLEARLSNEVPEENTHEQ